MGSIEEQIKILERKYELKVEFETLQHKHILEEIKEAVKGNMTSVGHLRN